MSCTCKTEELRRNHLRAMDTTISFHTIYTMKHVKSICRAVAYFQTRRIRKVYPDERLCPAPHAGLVMEEYEDSQKEMSEAQLYYYYHGSTGGGERAFPRTWTVVPWSMPRQASRACGRRAREAGSRWNRPKPRNFPCRKRRAVHLSAAASGRARIDARTHARPRSTGGTPATLGLPVRTPAPADRGYSATDDRDGPMANGRRSALKPTHDAMHGTEAYDHRWSVLSNVAARIDAALVVRPFERARPVVSPRLFARLIKLRSGAVRRATAP